MKPNTHPQRPQEAHLSKSLGTAPKQAGDGAPSKSPPGGVHGRVARKAKHPLKKYEATLAFSQQSRAKVIIKAASLEEAHEKADSIQADDVDNWNPCDGQVDVIGVEPI
jgi:hypothetical protein